jgi:hypothetical protein
LEDCVLPLITATQDVLQYDLVNRYYGMAEFVRGKSKHPIHKSLRNLLDKKLNNNNGDCPFIVVLDPNTIPLMTQVNIDKFSALETVATKGQLSINEAAEFLSIDLPHNPLRDKIFISTTVQELTAIMPDNGVLPLNDETNDAIEQETGHSNDANQRTMAEVKHDDKLESIKVKTLHNLYRNIRKHVLQNNQSGKIYTLAEVDEMCRETYVQIPALKKEVRKDLFLLKRLVKNLEGEVKERAIKDFYNNKKNSVLRSLIND